MRNLVIQPVKVGKNREVSEEAKAIIKAKAEHIRQHVPILRFLADLGYRVDPKSPEDQQFSCDLHGGLDRKPSAKVYISSSSWYCWACHKTRDHISTLREKVPGITFSQAYERIAGEYGVPAFKPGMYGVSTVAGGGEEETYTPEEVQQIQSKEDFERARTRLNRLLTILTRERSLTLRQAAKLWASYDAVCWHIDNQEWSPVKGTSYLGKMRLKVMSLAEGQHGRESEGAGSAC